MAHAALYIGPLIIIIMIIRSVIIQKRGK